MAGTARRRRRESSQRAALADLAAAFSEIAGRGSFSMVSRFSAATAAEVDSPLAGP
jgi:hypothetical protein